MHVIKELVNPNPFADTRYATRYDTPGSANPELSYPSIFRYSFLLMNAKAISVAAPVMVQEIG